MPGLKDGNLYSDPEFRKGFAVLADMGLCFDAYHYHHQNRYLTELARAFPSVRIVNNHLGTPLGVGPYEDRKEEVFEEWARDIAEQATCPNVFMKLGYRRNGVARSFVRTLKPKNWRQIPESRFLLS